MKNIITESVKFLIVICGAAFTLSSCEYKQIADADYPEQKIYMPAALKGNFVINNVPQPTLADPTPGNPYNVIADTINKKFIIPLGVYRSGINNAGSFPVDIAINNDTINKLLLIVGKLPVGAILLNANKYSIPSSVVMKDGDEVAGFDLSVNLDSLRNNPTRIYALGVGISSTQRISNPKFSTTIVVIYATILKPVATFTSAIDATNIKIRNFTNTSLYGMTYSWDFGDGSAVSTLKSPSHTYAAAGTYTVKLTVIGLTGVIDKSTITNVITVL